jgi:hypothetical protein
MLDDGGDYRISFTFTYCNSASQGPNERSLDATSGRNPDIRDGVIDR